jgi:DNA polymerase III alpha subunit (gram-positive type)
MGGFSQNHDSQVGIAILNIKDLFAPQLKKNIISTYNLVTGSPSYISKASKKYLFGQSMIIDPTKILKNIQSIIPRDRPIILVAHNVKMELMVLTQLGFELSSLNADIIDTANITNEVFGGPGYSLREVLTSLNCPFNNLHSGGNDANFTLRA